MVRVITQERVMHERSSRRLELLPQSMGPLSPLLFLLLADTQPAVCVVVFYQYFVEGGERGGQETPPVPM